MDSTVIEVTESPADTAATAESIAIAAVAGAMTEPSDSVRSPDPADGRELRSRRTRSAIVEGWLDLVEGGNVSPTAREIADQAGIGLRTIFQHFDDMEALQANAAALHFERVSPFFRLEPTGTFAERVAQFSLHRKRLFERITPVRRAALHRVMLAPNLGNLLKTADDVFAALAWSAFAPELASVADPTEAQVLKHSAGSALSWAVWEYLRTSSMLTSAEAAQVFSLTCERLFTHE